MNNHLPPDVCIQFVLQSYTDNGSIGVSGSSYCTLQYSYEAWISQRHHSHLDVCMGIPNISEYCWSWVTVPHVSIVTSCNSDYSNHDFVGLCNVESIQENPLSPPFHLCAAGHHFHCFCRALQYHYISLRYFLNLHVLLRSHSSFCSYPTSLSSSHSCPNHGFLCLQPFMEQHTMCYWHVWWDPTICAQCYAFDSGCHSNIEAVS